MYGFWHCKLLPMEVWQLTVENSFEIIQCLECEQTVVDEPPKGCALFYYYTARSSNDDL
jgi:hypothetical protein